MRFLVVILVVLMMCFLVEGAPKNLAKCEKRLSAMAMSLCDSCSQKNVLLTAELCRRQASMAEIKNICC